MTFGSDERIITYAWRLLTAQCVIDYQYICQRARPAYCYGPPRLPLDPSLPICVLVPDPRTQHRNSAREQNGSCSSRHADDPAKRRHLLKASKDQTQSIIVSNVVRRHKKTASNMNHRLSVYIYSPELRIHIRFVFVNNERLQYLFA